MVKTANAISLNLLPEKLKERYIMAYEKLLKLRKINKIKSLTENVFLTNFNELSTEIRLICKIFRNFYFVLYFYMYFCVIGITPLYG
jgi:hypothetical protein